MIRQIPCGLSHSADAATRSWRSLNPPTATLLFYEVTLAVPDATNRQPVFVSYANHRHMGNLPQQARKSRMLSSSNQRGFLDAFSLAFTGVDIWRRWHILETD